MADAPISFGQDQSADLMLKAQQQQALADALAKQLSGGIQTLPGKTMPAVIGNGMNALGSVLNNFARLHAGKEAATLANQAQQSQNAAANDFMSQYSNAAYGTQASGEGDSATPASPADPNRARQLLYQAMTSSDPRLQKFASIQLAQIPNQGKPTEKDLLAEADWTPESLQKYRTTGNFSDLVAMKEDPEASQGHWEKAPGTGRNVWIDAKNSAHFEPNERAPQMTWQMGTLPDGTPANVARNGRVVPIPGAANDRQKADMAASFLNSGDEVLDMLHGATNPGVGIAGKILRPTEDVGNLLKLTDEVTANRFQSNLSAMQMQLRGLMASGRFDKSQVPMVENVLRGLQPGSTIQNTTAAIQDAQRMIYDAHKHQLDTYYPAKPSSQPVAPQPNSSAAPSPAAAPMSLDDYLKQQGH